MLYYRPQADVLCYLLKLRQECRDKDFPGVITYKFEEGGMQDVRASVALFLADDSAVSDVNITVRPYVDASCKPPAHLTDLQRLQLHPMANGWKFVEIEYSVGSLPALNCALAKFVEISFTAPEGSDVQLMYLKLIGDGFISDLQELDDPSINPSDEKGIFDNGYVLWILIGVGTVFILILGLLVWCCCGRPCCGKRQQDHVRIPSHISVPTAPVSFLMLYQHTLFFCDAISRLELVATLPLAS